jgi:transposase
MWKFGFKMKQSRTTWHGDSYLGQKRNQTTSDPTATIRICVSFWSSLSCKRPSCRAGTADNWDVLHAAACQKLQNVLRPLNHRVIVFDQAAWHTTSKLQVPKNISLLPLTPASPELNPTEQVWQALRDRYLGNRYYEHILECCCEAWNAFTSVADAVRKLCSRERANIMC